MCYKAYTDLSAVRDIKLGSHSTCDW